MIEDSYQYSGKDNGLMVLKMRLRGFGYEFDGTPDSVVEQKLYQIFQNDMRNGWVYFEINGSNVAIKGVPSEGPTKSCRFKVRKIG